MSQANKFKYIICVNSEVTKHHKSEKGDIPDNHELIRRFGSSKVYFSRPFF